MSKWTKTSTTNLIRYNPTGTYYIRAKINGRVIHESLGTTRKALAIEKLSALLQSRRSITPDTMTVRQAIDRWLEDSERAHNIKPSTKKYHQEIVEIIRRTWPDLNQEVHRVTGSAVLQWADHLLPNQQHPKGRGLRQYSPARYNAAVGILRGIFRVAIDAGAIIHNPAAKLTKQRVILKEPTVPDPAMLQTILRALAARRGGGALVFIKFLAYSGMRRNEAIQVTWAMTDLEHRQFRLPARITKNGKPRIVPIIPQMLTLLQELQAMKHQRAGYVLPITTAWKVMKNTLAREGLPHLTHHTFRHLFTTYCLNHGVDVPTVARWRGDSDGGAMMLKIYSHLLDSHSQQMAEGLKF